MGPPRYSRQRKKETFANDIKTLGKAVLFSDSTGRPSNLAPNIRSLSWSPTGSYIATAISAHVRIWSPEKPAVKYSTELRNAGGMSVVEKVAFCPNQEAVLATTGADGMCRLWDVRIPGGPVVGGKGTRLVEMKTGDTGLFLTWHPSGQELLVGRKDDVVQLVDVRRVTADATWSATVEEKTLEKDKGQLNGMAFSNSGAELFVTTGEGPVKILDWPSLETIHVLDGHTGATNTVLESPAGTFVAVGGNDSIITLWDTQYWHCAHSLMKYNCSIRDLSFSFDGAYIIASGGQDARDGGSGLRISHADTGEEIVCLETQNPVSWTAWHPHRYWIAYAGDPGGLKIIGAGSPVL